MYHRPIVPENFTVPLALHTAEFTLRPLTIHDVIRDYDAVMTSAAHLRGLMEPDRPRLASARVHLPPFLRLYRHLARWPDLPRLLLHQPARKHGP
jgi:hypothetical protein